MVVGANTKIIQMRLTTYNGALAGGERLCKGARCATHHPSQVNVQ